jgi:acyl-CoA synthetase (AMP-forming)/AMP-acid ligase II
MAETTLAVSGVTPGTGARTVRLVGPLSVGLPVTIGEKGVLGVDRPADSVHWLSSCGGPVPETTIEINDEGGAVLPEGHVGEIRVSGTSVAVGYQSDEPIASDPFTSRGLRTGDTGFLLDGELYVIGRIGDSLKVRGRKIHAEDVETALTTVPGIRAGRCAVALGTWQGRNRAVVVVESSDTRWLDPAAGVLRAALDDSVALTVVRARRGAIPRTSSGKPRRRVVWRHACDDELPGEIVHDTFTTTPTAHLDGAAR